MSIDFNSYADAYLRNRSVQPKVLEGLIAGCGLEPNDAVLVIGCGTANYLAALVAETGAVGFGIDPAEEMLAQARSDSSRSNLALSVSSAESLPFADGTFRFVFSVDVVHHIGDPRAYATEAFRVLTPGGRFCTVTDSHEDIVNRVPLSSHFPETVPFQLERYPSIESIQGMLKSAGFANMSTVHVNYPYPLTDITPFRERAFSALQLISDEQFAEGITRLERDLAQGPIPAQSLYTLIWATKPAQSLFDTTIPAPIPSISAAMHTTAM
jgi:SAM-dependent methyltransferase